MKTRAPFTKKHIHQWKLHPHSVEPVKYVTTCYSTSIIRVCDCGEEEQALLKGLDGLPTSQQIFRDVTWTSIKKGTNR